MTASYSLLTDVNGKPLPQMEDGHSGQPQVIQGAGSSSSIVRGRWWQVGSGATTTSIPMKSENGYTLTLTSQVQSQLVGSLFECLIGSTLYQAIVNAVSSSGTLTLDSALGSAPSAGTQFLLTPPDQTSLTGSTATIPVNPSQNPLPVSTFSNVTVPAGSIYNSPHTSTTGLNATVAKAAINATTTGAATFNLTLFTICADGSVLINFNGQGVNRTTGSGTSGIIDANGAQLVGGLDVWAQVYNNDTANALTLNNGGVYLH